MDRINIQIDKQNSEFLICCNELQLCVCEGSLYEALLMFNNSVESLYEKLNYSGNEFSEEWIKIKEQLNKFLNRDPLLNIKN